MHIRKRSCPSHPCSSQTPLFLCKRSLRGLALSRRPGRTPVPGLRAARCPLRTSGSECRSSAPTQNLTPCSVNEPPETGLRTMTDSGRPGPAPPRAALPVEAGRPWHGAEGPSEGSGGETLARSLWEPSGHLSPCSSVKQNPGTEPQGDGRGMGVPGRGWGGGRRPAGGGHSGMWWQWSHRGLLAHFTLVTLGGGLSKWSPGYTVLALPCLL
ncbi:hypothetical protein HJG60_009469 [Phyllostomus discolor]|uniref:Uncharacterized protein n=1 Tax=Phyllostomus discolor TaxID=89673 RepID=A0A834DCT4_9CHIR|nr:hypothetical protein HJG60_009469 [Phyllostomus discolor]